MCLSEIFPEILSPCISIKYHSLIYPTYLTTIIHTPIINYLPYIYSQAHTHTHTLAHHSSQNSRRHLFFKHLTRLFLAHPCPPFTFINYLGQSSFLSLSNRYSFFLLLVYLSVDSTSTHFKHKFPTYKQTSFRNILPKMTYTTPFIHTKILLLCNVASTTLSIKHNRGCAKERI